MLLCTRNLVDLCSSIFLGRTKLPVLMYSGCFIAADLIPEFGKKFGDVSASVGQPVKVAVQFSGKPKKVQWFHKGIEIDSGGRYNVSAGAVLNAEYFIC